MKDAAPLIDSFRGKNMGNIQPNKSTAIVPAMPRGMAKVEPDDGRFVNKFHVNSASSDRVYRISYDKSPGAGWWICSCMAGISRGTCKHLTSIGLHPTRAEVMAKRLAPPPKKLPSRPHGR